MKKTAMMQLISTITMESTPMSIKRTATELLATEKADIESAWFDGALDTNAYIEYAQEYYQKTFKQEETK